MKVDGRHTRTIWVEADGASVGTIDQTMLPHRYATMQLRPCGCRARDQVDAGARRAADRRDRGLRRRAGAARGCLRCGAGARLRAADRDAPDRDQSEMGARRDDGGGAQSSARGARRRRLQARGRDRRRGRRDQPGDRPQWTEADRGDRGEEESRRAGQRAHALQCRLARDRRLGHRDRADLHGARCGRCRSMCGSTRRGRATRAPRSPHGSSASTACRIP